MNTKLYELRYYPNTKKQEYILIGFVSETYKGKVPFGKKRVMSDISSLKTIIKKETELNEINTQIENMTEFLEQTKQALKECVNKYQSHIQLAQVNIK